MKNLATLFILLLFAFACKQKTTTTNTKTIVEPTEAPVVLTPGKDTLKLPVVINVADMPVPKTTVASKPISPLWGIKGATLLKAYPTLPTLPPMMALT